MGLIAKIAFPLLKAALFYNIWRWLTRKVVLTCPALGDANVNGSEPVAILTASARATRESLAI